MRNVVTVAALREVVATWRRAGLRVGFVPTMGNLHAGHLSLIERACALADRVVASIFVNPLQFGPQEDLASYPRTPERDSAALAQAGCDLLFQPGVSEMYPLGETQTRVCVGGLGGELCGAYRSGHFDGMATVVVKLLNQVGPDFAVFGQKDYQQLVVIRQVVADLDLPVEVHVAPTVREPDGLAMSSRNLYLTPHERGLAGGLYATLRELATALIAGDRDFAALGQAAVEKLTQCGFAPDYVEVRAPDLGIPRHEGEQFVVLAAARLGKARLIDNVIVEL